MKVTNDPCRALKEHDALTRIQQETLEALFRGYTVPEIAAMRHRAPKTVAHALESLQMRTESRNARELVYEALARGWLTPPTKLTGVGAYE